MPSVINIHRERYNIAGTVNDQNQIGLAIQNTIHECLKPYPWYRNTKITVIQYTEPLRYLLKGEIELLDESYQGLQIEEFLYDCPYDLTQFVLDHIAKILDNWSQSSSIDPDDFSTNIKYVTEFMYKEDPTFKQKYEMVRKPFVDYFHRIMVGVLAVNPEYREAMKGFDAFDISFKQTKFILRYQRNVTEAFRTGEKEQVTRLEKILSIIYSELNKQHSPVLLVSKL